MKAVVYKQKGVFDLEERPMPRILDPRDAIVRVTLCSICSSDLYIKHGSVPRAEPGVVVGHEMVGVVIETGEAVVGFRAGDRVTVNVETFCGECFYCKRGFVNNCVCGGWELGCRIDGGQAEYVRVPFADCGLDRIPEGVSDEAALFTGDILATGYWAAKIGGIGAGDTVAVLGAGPTGLCSMACAKLYHPAHIVAVDLREDRLALAQREGFADIALNAAQTDVAAALREMTEGRGADVVMEAAGGRDTLQTAWQIARPNATVCIVALYESPQALPLPQMYGKNLTFKTGGVDACDCGEILRLIAAGKIDMRPLITHTLSLDRAMEAYDLFEQRRDNVIKVALKP